MGRPIGSVNRAKPFADALRLEIRAGNDHRHLRAIARKLIKMAEGGDLQASERLGNGWTVSARRPSNAAMTRWKRCLIVNCSRSFGADHAKRQISLRLFAGRFRQPNRSETAH